MKISKNMISPYLDVDNHQNTWDMHLSEFQLAYNSSPHQATKFSPFSLVHDREARLLATPDFGVKTIPIDEYHVQSKGFLAHAHNIVQLENHQTQAANAIKYNAQRQTPTFEMDDLVLVDSPILSNASLGCARKLVRRFRGPFVIIKVPSPDRYDLQEKNTLKILNNVHAARIKPYNSNEAIAQSDPPNVVSRVFYVSCGN